MNEYETIFKRKSQRRFDNNMLITALELNKINDKINNLSHLFDDIDISFKIVKARDIGINRGEYVVLCYSETKDNYLINVGYMFEQLDLFLNLNNIGTCYYGFGKPNLKTVDGKEFVIMMCMGKCKIDDFRKDYTKAKRKETCDIWHGDFEELGDIVKYAPSACNSQPWYVECEKNLITVYKNLNVSSLLNLTQKLKAFYNYIDVGIFIYFLEITLKHYNYSFEREFLTGSSENNLVKIVNYEIKFKSLEK